MIFVHVKTYPMTKVAVVDDHYLFRRGLINFLVATNLYLCIAEASDG
jgi:YesN/AraC family two-component response regulator